MTEAKGVMCPTLHAITADRLAHDLRKMAQTQDLSDDERQSLQDASSLLIRQAATIALVRNALGE